MALFVTKQTHAVVVGDESGLIDVDARSERFPPEVAIDWFKYLPHIDGTTDYTVRHGGWGTIAIIEAVRPLLRDRGMQGVWEHYLTQSPRSLSTSSLTQLT